MMIAILSTTHLVRRTVGDRWRATSITWTGCAPGWIMGGQAGSPAPAPPPAVDFGPAGGRCGPGRVLPRPGRAAPRSEEGDDSDGRTTRGRDPAGGRSAHRGGRTPGRLAPREHGPGDRELPAVPDGLGRAGDR